GHFTTDHSQRPDLSSRCRGDSSERLRTSSYRSRVRDLARAQVRLVSRDRVIGARLREYRPDGRGGQPVQRGDGDVDRLQTYLNYATFLAAQNRNDEARQWARRILAKKPTMPRYLQRRERPWFRKASALLKLLGAVG